MVPDSPRLAYNLARSLERAGRLDEAISEYEHYLRLAPGADDVADVLQVLAALKRMVGEGRGKLAVTSAPPGATVFIDGSTDPAGVTPLRVWLSPGTHRVRVELEDLPPLERLVDVEAGALAEVAAVLAPEGAPDGGPDEAGAGFPWHLAAAGVAVAAAGGAAWSGLAARGGLADAASATDRPAYQEAVDRAERSATLATVLWAGAGGAAAAALALWLLAGPEGEPAVAVGPGPLGAVVCGRF